MAVEDSVAQDQLRAFIERIERMEEEKAAIASDIKEIYAEAKGNGFDTKILRKIVAIRKQDANERMEQNAILDLYMAALGMVAAPHEDDDYTPTFGSNVSRAPASLDDLVEQLADHVDPKLLMNIIEGSKTEAGRKIIMGALAAVNSGDVVSAAHIENIEPQPAPQAESDLTDPKPLGQVAEIQPETAEPVPSTDGINEPLVTVAADANTGGENVAADDADTQDNLETRADASELALGSDVEPVAPKSLYAEPGVITWESCPPEGVVQHEYSKAFGTLGQDIAVIEDDLLNAKAEPIVKMGNVILDGWARYNKARSITGLDGKSLEYPVVQYDGRDPLLDCIRWNLAGRILTDDQKRLVATRLGKIYPQRRGIIMAEFELGMEIA